MKRLQNESDVSDLFKAPAYAAALGAAIETGLLWILAENTMDGDTVAAALNIPASRCHYWLQILDALGILEALPQGYAPSALARSAILESHSQASWKHLVMDERERAAGVHNLALYIRTPGSVWQAQGLNDPRDYVEKMRADAARAREFTRMLYQVHQRLAQELAARLDLTNVQRLMDLGGNSGVVSIALLQKYPALTATVVDLENVCMAGREIAAENSLTDRLAYHAADFFNDEFPTGYDMVLLCDVGIFSEAFFHKVWASLNENGRVVLVDHFSPAENIAPEARLEWSFFDSLENPNFNTPTLAQVQTQLLHSGFRPLRGETTLFDQRILIQARRVSEGAANANIDA